MNPGKTSSTKRHTKSPKPKTNQLTSLQLLLGARKHVHLGIAASIPRQPRCTAQSPSAIMDDEFLMADTCSETSTSSSRDPAPSHDDMMQCPAKRHVPEEWRRLMRFKKPNNGTELNVVWRHIRYFYPFETMVKGRLSCRESTQLWFSPLNSSIAQRAPSLYCKCLPILATRNSKIACVDMSTSESQPRAGGL